MKVNIKDLFHVRIVGSFLINPNKLLIKKEANTINNAYYNVLNNK